MNQNEDTTASRLVEFNSAGISMGRRWNGVDRLLGERQSSAVVRWSDVVVYELQGRLIAHRVVRRIANSEGGISLVTKGDGYWTPDRIPVPLANVKAVIRAVGTGAAMREVNRGTERWIGYVQALCGWIASLIWPPIRG